MKTLLSILLIISFECSGQRILKSDTAAMSTGYKKSDLYIKNQGSYHTFFTQSDPPVAIYLANSDTLFILPKDKIHFIKIGERVYKIESPTLTEVNKIDTSWRINQNRIIQQFFKRSDSISNKLPNYWFNYNLITPNITLIKN